MAQRLAVAKGGIDLEALSPRDANAQRMPNKAAELKAKAVQFKTAKEKDHPPPPPPQVVEPSTTSNPDGAIYQVGKLLGKGGFAVCYHGQLQGTKQRHALKIVKSKMAPKMEQKFQTELQIHSKMKHKNIVQFFRAFTFDQCTYLVLELCPNGSLMDMVKRRKGLTEPEVRFYSVQIAGAIKYMHGKGIIHRDLKMGNIFLDSRMNAKIGDFGLAALVVTGRDMQTIRRTTLCGTPNYIAPEILHKDRKGHDHMVDIWSLGIIVFAMLTSKPPFQSSTTEEIYRRAKNRDYEWPDPSTSQKYISAEAKDLVSSMLEVAEERPDPDAIVGHPWFRVGYFPTPAEINVRLRDVPPDRQEFYMDELSEELYDECFQNLKAMCRDCVVGPWNSTQIVHTQVWKEMAAEEKACLTPAIPLAEGIVYRPFEEWLKEQPQKLRARYATATATAPALPHAIAEGSMTGTVKIPTGLLRQPPQSFAAQQRAQNRPIAPAPVSIPISVASSSSSAPTIRQQTENRSNVPASAPAPAPAPAPIATLRSRPKKDIRRALDPTVRSRPDPVQKTATVPAMTATLGPSAPSRCLPAEKKPGVQVQVQVSEFKQDAPPPTQTAAPKPSKQMRTVSIFSPLERVDEVPGTRPDAILDGLRRLQAELERALNARTMAIITSKTVPPPLPRVVVKWVDYTNKFGLGYILNDGSVGCVLRDMATADGSSTAMLPPAGMLVQNAERHVERRHDESYADRQQPVPMDRHIHFYENHAERGLKHVAYSPEPFRVSVGDDGAPGKLRPGQDAYQHRKRERVILWKKFANYMIAYGRDEGVPADEGVQPRVTSGSTESPAQMVIFYQRFGDVGCWVFRDGHLQFNFPDHTKIVLDSTGSWCHFWHLSTEAATELAISGTVGEAALDQRAMLSYPLQTLLNFQTKPSAARPGRTASSSRRRPEISPELQGIPAANDFRRKVEFIKNVVKEWVNNQGMGNSDFSREKRLRWTGFREYVGVQSPQKHVWVTVGARWGDSRVQAYVDPRRPAELGQDFDEDRRKVSP